MTKIISISKVQNSVQTLIALTKNGDEIVLEENGEAIINYADRKFRAEAACFRIGMRRKLFYERRF